MSRSRIALAAIAGVGVLAAVSVPMLEGKPHSSSSKRDPPSDITPDLSEPESSPGGEKAAPKSPRSEAAVARRAPLPPAREDRARNEAELMHRLRELRSSDPPTSLEWAREGNERFPESPHAPERVWFEVRALVDLQRFDEARQRAQDMVARYPDTGYTRDVARHMLTHPFGLPPRAH